MKRAGGSCFFEQPDTSNLLDAMQEVLGDDIMVLPEIHEHYTMQFKVSEMGYWVYDFALPVLTLHALYSGDGQYLKRWMEMSPKHQFTTLDTHDGLGIVDVKDLLPDDQTDWVKEKMFSEGANVKKIYNTEAYNNLDIYQVNTSFSGFSRRTSRMVSSTGRFMMTKSACPSSASLCSWVLSVSRSTTCSPGNS